MLLQNTAAASSTGGSACSSYLKTSRSQTGAASKRFTCPASRSTRREKSFGRPTAKSSSCLTSPLFTCAGINQHYTVWLRRSQTKHGSVPSSQRCRTGCEEHLTEAIKVLKNPPSQMAGSEMTLCESDPVKCERGHVAHIFRFGVTKIFRGSNYL